MFTASRSILAAAALVLSAPAWAASNGSFTTGPVKFELIDLRPDDGIAPSVSFETLPGQEGGVAAQGAQLSPFQLELRAQYKSWANSQISSATRMAKAKASVTGGGSDGVAGGAMMAGSGSAKNFVGPADAFATFYAQSVLSSAGENIRFTLSPWTALVATFDANVKLTSTRANDGADATAVLSLTLDGQEQHKDEFAFECSGPCTLAEGRALNVTVANESDAAIGGGWWAMATVGGFTQPPTGSESTRNGAAARAREKLNALRRAAALATPKASSSR